MKALYDLSWQPANFNFLEFLVAATTRGADEIVIDRTRLKGKYPAEVTEGRITNILLPACELADVKVSFGRVGIPMDYHIDAVLRAYHDMGFLRKLRSVRPHGKQRYTVTIRDFGRHQKRDSNQAAWRTFADEIGAYVIEDYYTQPIHLHDRMALYCGAEMNFFVSNGPAALCMFSDAPYLAMQSGIDEAYMIEHNFPPGSQWPWANWNQMMVWKDDTLENIREAFSEYEHRCNDRATSETSALRSYAQT